MSQAETVVNSIKEASGRGYSDEELCDEIQKRIESKLAAKKMTIAERAEFVNRIKFTFFLI
jgi:hypothetical protein